MIAAAALTGLVLGILVRRAVPFSYYSRTLLEVRSPNERFLNRAAFDPRSLDSTSNAEWYLQGELQILSSDQLLRNVLSRLAGKEPAGQQALAARLGVSPSDLAGSGGQSVERLRRIVRSRVLPQTRLIEVAAVTGDSRFSADLANAIASQFAADEGAAQLTAMAETRQTLAREIDELKARLVASQNELNRFLRTAGVLMSGRNDILEEGQLLRTQTELASAQAERIRVQARFEQLGQSDASALPDVLNDATLKDFHTSLAGLRRELADLQTTLAPKHYRVQKLRAQIELLERERDAHQSKIVARIRNEYSAAERRERLLDGAYRRSAERVTDQTAKGLRYAQLKSEMEANRQIYETMLARLKETEVISAIGTSNIRVVDPAWPAPKPRMPNYWQAGAIGLSAGLFAAALAVLARQSASRRLSEPDEVAAVLRIAPVLVTRTGRAPVVRRGTADLSGWSPAALESYAAIIASMEGDPQPGEDGRPGRCYVVSSPGPGDGKTVTAMGLGVAVARGGQRVLLVNGDLIAPRLHELLEADNSEGLADLLAEGDLSHLEDLIHSTPVRGLAFLPGGPAVGGTVQLFDSPLLEPLLRRLRDRFDLIVIDTPGLLEAPDARLMARYTDAVILVVRPEHTDRSAAAEARQRLASFGLTLGAVVCNDAGAPLSAAPGQGGALA